MSADDIIDDEYASEEDSDFAPDVAPAENASEASEPEDEAEQPAPTAKRKRAADAADDAGYENSGDEAIISRGKKRQKKKQRKDGANGDEDDEGGEGGLIKTRSMRAVEKTERKTHAVTGPVTVNVEDLWAKMAAGPVVPSNASADKENTRPEDGGESGGNKADREAAKSKLEKPREAEPSATIKIKRTYNFAGKVHTEEKLVPRDSAEAKVYLASLGTNPEDAENTDDEQPLRQPRKAFRSIFEPIMEGMGQRADLNLGVLARLQMREHKKAKKLNVVEKSRMDWAGFVDKEGIKDDLELAGKSKESFASRQDFLGRVEAKREEDARKARAAGRA